MSALSRRSFFAALAGAPVAAAAVAAGRAPATKTVGHLGVTISANTNPFHAALARASAALQKFASHPALTFLSRAAAVEIDLARDGESEADVLKRLLDAVAERTAREYDALAIDAMINEGGRDWS